MTTSTLTITGADSSDVANYRCVVTGGCGSANSGTAALTPADGLAEEDVHYLLDNFFMVHPDQMIRPYKRYNELYQKKFISAAEFDRRKTAFETANARLERR